MNQTKNGYNLKASFFHEYTPRLIYSFQIDIASFLREGMGRQKTIARSKISFEFRS